MSVLVKGMRMPTGCVYEGDNGKTEYCLFCNHEDVPFCTYLEDEPEAAIGIDERPVYCPLVEVPVPHGRLIEFIDVPVFKDEDTGTEEVKFGDVLRAFYEMRNAPTVIEAEGEG